MLFEPFALAGIELRLVSGRRRHGARNQGKAYTADNQQVAKTHDPRLIALTNTDQPIRLPESLLAGNQRCHFPTARHCQHCACRCCLPAPFVSRPPTLPLPPRKNPWCASLCPSAARKKPTPWSDKSRSRNSNSCRRAAILSLPCGSRPTVANLKAW